MSAWLCVQVPTRAFPPLPQTSNQPVLAMWLWRDVRSVRGSDWLRKAAVQGTQFCPTRPHSALNCCKDPMASNLGGEKLSSYTHRVFANSDHTWPIQLTKTFKSLGKIQSISLDFSGMELEINHKNATRHLIHIWKLNNTGLYNQGICVEITGKRRGLFELSDNKNTSKCVRCS